MDASAEIVHRRQQRPARRETTGCAKAASSGAGGDQRRVEHELACVKLGGLRRLCELRDDLIPRP